MAETGLSNLLIRHEDQLTDKIDTIGVKINKLRELRIKQVVQSSGVQNALEDLSGVTKRLTTTAEEMKTATKIIETAAHFIGLIENWIGFAGKVFG